jgi:hypothetical protein
LLLPDNCQHGRWSSRPPLPPGLYDRKREAANDPDNRESATAAPSLLCRSSAAHKRVAGKALLATGHTSIRYVIVSLALSDSRSFNDYALCCLISFPFAETLHVAHTPTWITGSATVFDLWTKASRPASRKHRTDNPGGLPKDGTSNSQVIDMACRCLQRPRPQTPMSHSQELHAMQSSQAVWER